MKTKHMIPDLYLLCPLDSILVGVVANLALEVTQGFVTKVINIDLQRFLKQSAMGHSWLLFGDMTQRVSQKSKTDQWRSFAGLLLPVLIIGSVVGGPSLSAKCMLWRSLGRQRAPTS